MTAIQRKIKVSDLEDRLRAAEAAVEESQKAVIECTEAYMSLQKNYNALFDKWIRLTEQQNQARKEQANGCNSGISRNPNFVSYDLRTFF